MNGLEQRVRHLAVAETQRQLEDLQTVVTELVGVVHELDGRIVALAGIVQQLDARFCGFAQGTADAFDALSERVEQTRRSVGQLHTETRLLTDGSLWHRVRWIGTGRWQQDNGDDFTQAAHGHFTRRVIQADQAPLQSAAATDAGSPQDGDDA